MRGSCTPYGIRKGNWKYLRVGGKQYNLGPELYNLADDLSESTNLLEKHPKLVAELDAMIESYISEL